jgi:hypothetical protein
MSLWLGNIPGSEDLTRKPHFDVPYSAQAKGLAYWKLFSIIPGSWAQFW